MNMREALIGNIIIKLNRANQKAKTEEEVGDLLNLIVNIDAMIQEYETKRKI